MQRLLIMVIASYALTAGAQVRQSENFLYLFNDSVVYANKVMLRPNFNGNLQIRADARQVPNNEVKFFNTNDGFFANTGKRSFIGTTSFSERIIEGKINVFREIPDNLFVRDRWNRRAYARQVVPTLRMYYNKGFGDLKKVRYNSLMEDMADNPQSIDLLKGYRKAANASKVLYVSAGASIVAGLVSFLVTGSNHEPTFGADFGKVSNFTTSYVLIGLSAGLALGGYATQQSAQRQLERTIDVYNK